MFNTSQVIEVLGPAGQAAHAIAAYAQDVNLRFGGHNCFPRRLDGSFLWVARKPVYTFDDSLYIAVY